MFRVKFLVLLEPWGFNAMEGTWTGDESWLTRKVARLLSLEAFKLLRWLGHRLGKILLTAMRGDLDEIYEKPPNVRLMHNFVRDFPIDHTFLIYTAKYKPNKYLSCTKSMGTR